MNLITYFKTLLDKTDIILTDQQIQQLIVYIELLNKWNKTYDLTSGKLPEQMVVRHILHSLFRYVRSPIPVARSLIPISYRYP